MPRITAATMLLLLFLTTASFGQAFEAGLGIGVKTQISANALQIAPGPSVGLSWIPSDEFAIRTWLHAGATLGYDISFGLGAEYVFNLGIYRPGIGLSASCSFGSSVYHATTAAAPLFPSFPEYGIGVDLAPARFRFGRIRVSMLETTVGTDLAAFGSVLVLDVCLLRLAVALM